MQAYLLVGFGGALGAMARYGVSGLFPATFPWATVAINVAGSLLMGLLAGVLARTLPGWQAEARLFFGVGILGGFTTFSAFSLDAVTLFERGEVWQATAYVAMSVVLSILGLVAGLTLVRAFA